MRGAGEGGWGGWGVEGQHLPAADLQERLWRGSELCQTQTKSIEKILTHACHGGGGSYKGRDELGGAGPGCSVAPMGGSHWQEMVQRNLFGHLIRI